ncbi:MAG TPA: phage holin family protein [Candidatus Bathyarchaeia archaeon]|nr:phage holin family protein [Candidatus Bathyarchaeia archaeon]
MKRHLRSYLINLAALWLVTQIISGVDYGGAWQTLLLAGLALTIVNLFIKPLINLLLLPVNLITLGAFRWLVNVATLYLVTILVPQFKVSEFVFPGFAYQGIVIPSLNLNLLLVFVIASFALSLVTSTLYWVFKK